MYQAMQANCELNGLQVSIPVDELSVLLPSVNPNPLNEFLNVRGCALRSPSPPPGQLLP